MFDIRKYALVIAAIIALVLVACAPETKKDCEEEHRDDQRGYEECLQELEIRYINQTATSAAIKAATATEEAVIAAERVEYAATGAALDESLKSTGDSQTLSRAGTITGQAPQGTAVAPPADAGSSDPVSATTATPVATSASLAPSTGATPVPIAPTAAPTPVPAPTEIPVDLSTLAWLTAQQAAELALMEVDGDVFEIAGHGARGAGELSTGGHDGRRAKPGGPGTHGIGR